MKTMILYSTGCPKCNVLMDKLHEKNQTFIINSNTEEMIALGIDQVPVLSVNGKLLDFSNAVKWLNEEV